MKNKFLLVVILTILAMIVVYFVISKREDGMVGPKLIQQVTRQQDSPTASPSPTPNTPKTFQFDSSTDLKAELEKVNPQVLDSDFE